MKTLGSLALITPLILWSATSAHAQQVAPSAAGAEANIIPEVVVTARKRSETAQSVPATVQVVDQEKIERAAVSSFRDLTKVAPGLNISNAPSPNQFAVTIRGLGSKPGNPSFDSSVSLFVDGVFTPRAREFSTALFDIKGLEMIRGTQAALLGKNTSLGAVNLITRKPGESFAVNARYLHEFELGSDRVEGGVDLPVSDTLKVRVSGLYNHEAGPMRDRISGQKGDNTVARAGRVVAVWTPTDSVDVIATYQLQKSHSHGPNSEFISYTAAAQALAAAAGYPGSLDPNLDYETAMYSSALGAANKGNLDAQRGALTVNWALGDHTLTSQTGFTGSKTSARGNVAYAPGNLALQYVDDKSRQLTQEVRLVSPVGQRLEYIVGALYLDGRYRNDTLQTARYPALTPPAPAITGSENTHFDQGVRAYSVFGQANYTILGPLKLSTGLRYTREDKDVDLGRAFLVRGAYALILPPYAPFSLSRSEESTDGSIGVSYTVSPSLMVYGSWGQGTKAGGFAQSASLLDKVAYDPEVAKTTEGGFKLQMDQRRWTINGAAFHTTVDDFQLVTFNGLNFVVGNTDLKSNGFEHQIMWAPARGIGFYWNNTYAKAQDTRVGGDIAFAPRWQGVVGATLEREAFAGLRLSADIDLEYRSSQAAQEKGVAVPRLDDSQRLNASIGLGSPARSWEVRLIGKNLNDEHALGFVFPGPLMPAGNVVGIPTNPRTIALQLSLKR